jgi:hypothetical protein
MHSARPVPGRTGRPSAASLHGIRAANEYRERGARDQHGRAKRQAISLEG